MTQDNASFFIFEDHTAAEKAIHKLGYSGFDMKKLSLLGNGFYMEEKPIVFYIIEDRIKVWGGLGEFWGGVWGLLITPAVFVLPSLGIIGMAGPIVAALVKSLDGAIWVGGLSGLGAALSQMLVPKEQIINYENALKAGKYLLIVHGNARDREMAHKILASSENNYIPRRILSLRFSISKNR